MAVRKPMLTQAIVHGLKEVLADVSMCDISGNKEKALLWIDQLVQHCSSPEYIEKAKRTSDRIQKHKRAKV